MWDHAKFELTKFIVIVNIIKNIVCGVVCTFKWYTLKRHAIQYLLVQVKVSLYCVVWQLTLYSVAWLFFRVKTNQATWLL